MPGVPRATTLEVDVGGDALALAVHVEDGEALVGYSGSGTTTWRSKRPGRSSAGSRMSGRLVAAIITMPVVASKPSISDEHLVERLLALVVAAAEAGAALAADGVDLVDEDDGPAHLAGRCEQVAHAAGADADEHLHEVRAA